MGAAGVALVAVPAADQASALVPDPLIALCTRWRAQWDETNATDRDHSDAEVDATADALYEIEDTISDTPAQGPEGANAKLAIAELELREVGDPDTDIVVRLALSAIADARRLLA